MTPMADLLYLSLWLRDYHVGNMLGHWKTLIEAFPVSAVYPGIRSLAIHPFDWAEAPAFERNFEAGTEAGDVIHLAAEFQYADYAYEAELHWDLWLPDSSPESEGWRRSPSVCSITCMGPDFESEGSRDRAALQVNFGLDTPFLPSEEDELPSLDPNYDPEMADLRTQANLRQLISFVHQLDQRLPVLKRLLWCESGENLAEKILAAWDMRL